MTLNSDPKFKEKLPIFFEKWHKFEKWNLINFNSRGEKSENLPFDEIFLSKVCNVWAKIIQTRCVAKKDLWFQKWHKEFGKFSHKKLKVMLDKSFACFSWRNVVLTTFYLLPQVTHSVFGVLPCAHVTCIGYFLI